MDIRAPLLVMIPLLTVAIPARATQQAEPPRGPGESMETAPPQEAPAEPAIDVDDAIRRAIEALDRLEVEMGAGTGEVGEALQALADEANQYIEIVQTQAPTSPWVAYLLGRAYALTGRRADATDQLMAFVQTREGRSEWRAYRTLGDLFVDEFPRLAQANYEKARVLNPNEPSAIYGLSVCALRRGDRDEALRLIREAITAQGKPTLRYVSHLARALNATGRFEEALAEAEKTLRLAQASMKDHPGARDPLMVVDAQYGQLIDILQARVNGPIPATPDEYVRLASAIRERAEIVRKLRLHDALLILEAGVVKTAPNTPASLMEQYGITLAEVGRVEAAVEAFNKLLTIDPDNATAKDWLRRLGVQPATDSDAD